MFFPSANYLKTRFLKKWRRNFIFLFIPMLFLTSNSIAKEINTGVNKIETMVVTATKTPHTQKDVPIQTYLITKEDIQKMNAQNIMEVLRHIPGIDVSVHDDIFGTYTWRAKLQGLSINDGYALVLVDGQRVMGCGQSGGMGEYGIGLNQIPVNMIERIEVVQGPASVLYGSDAVTGVINIITKQIPKKPEGGAGASYGWYKIRKRKKSDGTVQKPSDYGHYRNMSQGYVYYGDKLFKNYGYLLDYSYEDAEDVRQDPIRSYRHYFMSKFHGNINENLNFGLKWELSDYSKTDNRDENTYRLSGVVNFKPFQGHSITIKGYTYLWDFVHGYPGYAYGYKNGDIGYNQGELQYSWSIPEFNTLTIGGELQTQNIDYSIENPDNSHIKVNKDIRTSSCYVQDELIMLKKLTIAGGVRLDHHSVFGSEVNPKVGIMYRLTPTTTLRGSVGRAFKSPTIRQLYYNAPYKHGSYYIQSNPNLDPEKSIGYTVGVEQYLFNGNTVVNINGFRNDVDNMVIREDTGRTYNSLPLKIYKNVEKAWTQGIEFSLKSNLTQEFSISMSYTYTDSKNKDTGKELTYIPHHQIDIAPYYEVKKFGIGGGIDYSYVSKQYTNTDNTKQIDSYNLVDLNIFKRLSKKAKITFQADNIFDSDKGDEGNFRVGRAFIVKLDVKF